MQNWKKHLVASTIAQRVFLLRRLTSKSVYFFRLYAWTTIQQKRKSINSTATNRYVFHSQRSTNWTHLHITKLHLHGMQKSLKWKWFCPTGTSKFSSVATPLAKKTGHERNTVAGSDYNHIVIWPTPSHHFGGQRFKWNATFRPSPLSSFYTRRDSLVVFNWYLMKQKNTVLIFAAAHTSSIHTQQPFQSHA